MLSDALGRYVLVSPVSVPVAALGGPRVPVDDDATSAAAAALPDIANKRDPRVQRSKLTMYIVLESTHWQLEKEGCTLLEQFP